MTDVDKRNGLSRREFIKAAGVTAAGIAAGSMISGKGFAAAAPAPGRVIGANDRINVGYIGVGGMGAGHLNGMKKKEAELNIVCAAVCEVFQKRKDRALALSGCPADQVYGDWRKLLENKDIDAVLIATPDHWHAPITIAALEAGKHVYCEKPMTHTLDEGLRVAAAVKKTGKILQVGSQGCSDAKWHTAGKCVKDGKIGRVIWAQGGYCRNNPNGEWNYNIEPELTEQSCDWKMWLGSAPKRPFSPERYFRWRKYWDYGTGIIGDLWPHRLHPLMIAMNSTDFPKRVACLGANCCNTDEGHGEPRDVADSTQMLAEFPNGMQMYLAGSTVSELSVTDMVRGQKANMYLGGGKVHIEPESPYVDEIDKEDVPVVGPGESHEVHRKNWLDAIRGVAPANCSIELALPVQVIVSLAEMSYRRSKMANFDSTKMRVTF